MLRMLRHYFRSSERIRSAPSSFNVQPWSVVLVRDDDSRERLAATMLGGNAKKVQAAPVTAVFCADLGDTWDMTPFGVVLYIEKIDRYLHGQKRLVSK